MNETRKPSKWANTTREVIETVAGSGCMTHPVFMLGWPGDTAYKTEKLVEFVGEIGSSHVFSHLLLLLLHIREVDYGTSVKHSVSK